MIPHLEPNTTYAVHLRASSVSGGKDWVGSLTAQGVIHVFWGRTGQITQRSGKSGDLNALRKIMTQKMQGKDKYSLVDEYNQQHGWQSQKKQPASPTSTATQSSSPAKSKQAVPAVDWIDAPPAAIEWDF